VAARARRLVVAPLLLILLGVPSLGRAADDPDCLVEIGGVNLQTSTILDIQQALSDGGLTSRQLVERYLQRIAFYDDSALDEDGMTLNSIRELNPGALAEADRLDAERAAGTVRGPLHGIPVLLKDNVGTKDLPTTAGSIALEGSIPTQDAFLTARLRDAGAIILGKANLSEFANWVDPSMPSGYSSLGGQVVAPYNLGNPSGSSSGSGVATAMALSSASVGTETAGSIISPSFTNSIVGLKPTVGLISRSGVIPLAESYDTAGPMVRTVTDAAVMLGGMVGVDTSDPESPASESHLPPGHDYTPALQTTGLFGTRLGYDPSNRPSGAGGALWDQALADLRAAGAELIDIDDAQFDTTQNIWLAEYSSIPNEFKAGLNAYLASQPDPPSGVDTLSDIIAFNGQHTDKVKYGQKWLQASDATAGVREAGIPSREAARATSRTLINSTFSQYDLDAVISTNATYVGVGAAAGYPTLTIPMGYTGSGRTPINLSFLGRAWSEPELLRLGYAYEQHSLRRVPPTSVNDALFPNDCTPPESQTA
jgi:amidase